MKMSMDWHKQCLENMLSSLILKDKEIERLEHARDDLRSKCASYRKQIFKAEAEGKTAFDRDRYNHKRSA